MLNTYLMHRMNVWADWRARRLDGGLGYPKKSAFVVNPSSGDWSPEMDSAAWEVEQCVLALRYELRDVVMKSYTESGTKEQKAARCHCCVRTYDTRLTMAYREILGFLNDMAAGIKLPAIKVQTSAQI